MTTRDTGPHPQAWFRSARSFSVNGGPLQLSFTCGPCQPRLNRERMLSEVPQRHLAHVLETCVFLTQGTDHCFQANACSAIFQDSVPPWQDYRGCKTPSLLGSIRACAVPHDNTNKASGGTGTRTRKRLEKQAFSDVHYNHLTTPPSAVTPVIRM